MDSAGHAQASPNLTTRYCSGVLVEASDGQKMASDMAWSSDRFVFVDTSTRQYVGAATYRPNFHIVIEHDGSIRLQDSDEDLRVQSTAQFLSRGYFLSEGRVPRSSVYPRSSEGGSWYERMTAGTMPCFFLLQRIEDSSRLWLTVLDTTRGQVMVAHPVKPHEFASIWMREDTDVFHEALDHAGPDDAEVARKQVLSLLNQPTPPNLSRLWMATRGAEVLVNTEGPTINDIVDPLIPESLAEDKDVRDEFKVFLAMAILDYQLDSDPVDLSNALLPIRTLRGLYAAHLRYRMDGKEFPAYVRVFHDAASRRLQIYDGTRQEPMKPHEVAWLHIRDDSPDWTSKALKYCNRPLTGTSPLLSLPITRDQAAGDMELRRDRAALVFAGYSLRTVVDTRAIGLEQVLFRGSAHTWCHNHLAWIAALKTPEGEDTNGLREKREAVSGKKPSTLQLITLPTKALHELRNMIDESTQQNWRQIDWRTRSFNPELYDSRISQWTAPFWKLVKSEIPELSLSRLKARLGSEAQSSQVVLDRPSARVLDMTSSHFYLQMLESDRFLRNHGIDLPEVESILQRLLAAHVVSVQHVIMMSPLQSIAIDLQGEERAVCGLALAIIRGTPTTSAWFSHEGKSALLLTFLPLQYVRPVMKHIMDMASKLNVRATMDEVASYSGYLNDMYQRLLRKSDNKWDADLSDLLSQFSFADSPQAAKQ